MSRSDFEHVSAPLARILEKCRIKMDARAAKRAARASVTALEISKTNPAYLVLFDVHAERQQLLDNAVPGLGNRPV